MSSESGSVDALLLENANTNRAPMAWGGVPLVRFNIAAGARRVLTAGSESARGGLLSERS